MVQKAQVNLSLFSLSCFGVAWGTECGSLALAFFASTGGYALFWKALEPVQSTRKRFYYSFFWFSLVQALQLSWFPQHEVARTALWITSFLLITLLGCQWALFTLFLPHSRPPSLREAVHLSALWSFLEWIRLLPLGGWSWNPMAMALVAQPLGRQLGSWGGILLLSFWICWTNCITWQQISSHSFQRPSSRILWLSLLCFPSLFGFLHSSQSPQSSSMKGYSTLIVNSFLSPEEKETIHPLELWGELMDKLALFSEEKIDLVVLPEGFSPHPLDYLPYEWKESLPLLNRPHIRPPPLFLVQDWIREKGGTYYFSDGYFAQVIAYWLQAQVLLGAEEERENRARLFTPDAPSSLYYAKRKLVPVGEQIPFSFLRSWARLYGIEDSFLAGTKSHILPTVPPLVISICYEETFGHFIRLRQLSASPVELLIHLANDQWWSPSSSLKAQHLTHGRLRSVENGLFALRSCNEGIGVLLTPLGETLSPKMHLEKQTREWLTLSLYHFCPYSLFAPYSLWGDFFLLPFYLLLLLFIKKENLANINSFSGCGVAW